MPREYPQGAQVNFPGVCGSGLAVASSQVSGRSQGFVRKSRGGMGAASAQWQLRWGRTPRSLQLPDGSPHALAFPILKPGGCAPWSTIPSPPAACEGAPGHPPR